MKTTLLAFGALCLMAAAACAPVEKKAAASTSEPVKTESVVEDPYLWLEDIHGEKPLSWVHERNAETAKAYADTPEFETTRKRILEVLDSDARIPYVTKLGAHWYNFWKDAQHPLGLWRRTTLAEYRKPHPHWETVLDLDALSAKEGTRLVWRMAICLKPAYTHCLLALSPGGGDAIVMREFDLGRKTFIDDGFNLPESKSDVAWLDEDHLFVGTNFGPGSMTTSSYPRVMKLWTRGTPLASATTVYEVKEADISVGVNTARRSRLPAMKSSKFAASSEPPANVLPPTVQSVRSCTSSHSRCVSMFASSGTSIFASVPSLRRRNVSLV